MRKRADVNWSHACVGACSLWDPGDSSPPAASWDSARYLDFLLLHLREDKQNHQKSSVACELLQNAIKRKQQKR